MNRSRKTLKAGLNFVLIAGLFGSLAAARDAAALITPIPVAGYQVPAPSYTKQCDFSGVDALVNDPSKAVVIASGDLEALYSNAAIGGQLLLLEAGGVWYLSRPLDVAPGTVIMGAGLPAPILWA